MNSLYPILRRILVQVTKIATTVFLLGTYIQSDTCLKLITKSNN